MRLLGALVDPLIRPVPQPLPKSPLGKAIVYAHNQWSALMRYLDDGRLAISNNAAERALRPFARGRKNWLVFQREGGDGPRRS